MCRVLEKHQPDENPRRTEPLKRRQTTQPDGNPMISYSVYPALPVRIRGVWPLRCRYVWENASKGRVSLTQKKKPGSNGVLPGMILGLSSLPVRIRGGWL